MEIILNNRIEELIESGELLEVLTVLMIEHPDAFEALKEVIEDRI
jgi:hypothetical protein